jgi:hypothetical protein
MKQKYNEDLGILRHDGPLNPVFGRRIGTQFPCKSKSKCKMTIT